MAIKLLIGGSPCTHWSIAQKNNRETEPSGMGWELFKNYLIAKEKFKPDFFLYENNKSAAQPIKDQIAQELGVGSDPQARFTYINSALVSAQNRQRFYVTNFGDIEQPEDRGILLKDILERGVPCRVAESVCVAERGRYENGVIQQHFEAREDGKTNTLTRVSKDNNVAEPVCLRYERTEEAKRVRKQYEAGEVHHGFNELRTLQPRLDGKTNTISTVQKDNMIAEPIRVGDLPNEKGEISGSQATRIYDINGKSINLVANGGGQGAKTGLYAMPITETKDGKSYAITANYQFMSPYPNDYAAHSIEKSVKPVIAEPYIGQETPSKIYEVRNGLITIKDKQYPIKLADGYYIIRKLTVTECCRLQTMPDDYCKAVSATQAYKGLGNGWTAEVIIHLLNHALKDIPKDEEIVVLSLYDGIGTGRYCLDKMGFTNVKYHAYEIDKYPMAIANDNYPDIIQHGDAFAVREDSWKPPQTRSEWLDCLLEVR